MDITNRKWTKLHIKEKDSEDLVSEDSEDTARMPKQVPTKRPKTLNSQESIYLEKPEQKQKDKNLIHLTLTNN